MFGNQNILDYIIVFFFNLKNSVVEVMQFDSYFE